jgi:hypothetical protein
VFIIGEGKDTTIYVNKKLLDEYLEKRGFSIVWTTLGEKQVITDLLSDNFVGRAEFSESYIYQNRSIVENHYSYKVDSR